MQPLDLTPWWSLIAAACYALSAWLLVGALRRHASARGPSLTALLVLGAGSHGFALAGAVFAAGGPVLALGTAVSLVAWIAVLGFAAALLREAADSLGLVVLPVAAVAVLVTLGWHGPPMPLDAAGGIGIGHTLASVLAFGLLALAFCQAVLLLSQEWHLQNKRSGGFFHALPPLQTMEQVLFRLIGAGFALLTVALLSGVVFSQELFGRSLPFNHHVVLSLVAWLAFGTLLAGRRLFGWRGRVAAGWTIGSFALLSLGYFGTRFVLEILLGRR